MSDLKSEIQRRRTFAIISHPDAGKTTITERILYHGGVIRELGPMLASISLILNVLSKASRTRAWS